MCRPSQLRRLNRFTTAFGGLVGVSKLPQVTARELSSVLRRIGFIDDRQTGSHLILRHPITRRRAVVPMHRGDIKPKTLRAILADAGLTPEQLHKLL